jgi:hypothetical protein
MEKFQKMTVQGLQTQQLRNSRLRLLRQKIQIGLFRLRFQEKRIEWQQIVMLESKQNILIRI